MIYIFPIYLILDIISIFLVVGLQQTCFAYLAGADLCVVS